ncbi:Glycine--tRNA ligase alpha subunit [Bienertia sinuspersici]
MPEATLDGDAEKGALYKCTHCSNTRPVSVSRCTYKFKAVDATGTRKFTIFTREVETLFDMTSDKMHEIKYFYKYPPITYNFVPYKPIVLKKH